MSFFTADHEWWDVHVRSIPKPWPAESVLLDLRAHQSLAVAPKPVPFPSRRVLAVRWGWSEGMTRAMLANETRWSDPFIVGDRERSARWTEAVGERSKRNHQEPDNNPTTTRQLPANNPTTNGNPSLSCGAEPDSNPTTTRQLPDDYHTRVGSQSTDTEHRAQEKPAPAPAVADLFAPTSQPDAATGEATGDTAPPPSCAAPLPADEDAPADPGKPREPITPAMAQAIDVLAKLNPKAAERMTEGKSETLVRATRKAIKALGLPALLARLEYAAAAQDDEPMKFWRTTLGGKLAPLLTVDGPWVRGLDEAAAETAERIEDSGGVDLEAEAASAWFDMTQRRGWKTICHHGGAPNRPGDYGKPERWDLSDTADEHDRRMTAFLRAGSIPKWQMADAAGRVEFRARWIGFYVDEVKA